MANMLHEYLDIPLKFFYLFSDGQRANNIITFRSKKILGDWFGVWYHLIVELPLSTMIYLKDPITLRSILSQTNEIRVTRQPTGWVSFFYRHLSSEVLMDRRIKNPKS